MIACFSTTSPDSHIIDEDVVTPYFISYDNYLVGVDVSFNLYDMTVGFGFEVHDVTMTGGRVTRVRATHDYDYLINIGHDTFKISHTLKDLYHPHEDGVAFSTVECIPNTTMMGKIDPNQDVHHYWYDNDTKKYYKLEREVYYYSPKDDVCIVLESSSFLIKGCVYYMDDLYGVTQKRLYYELGGEIFMLSWSDGTMITKVIDKEETLDSYTVVEGKLMGKRSIYNGTDKLVLKNENFYNKVEGYHVVSQVSGHTIVYGHNGSVVFEMRLPTNSDVYVVGCNIAIVTVNYIFVYSLPGSS